MPTDHLPEPLGGPSPSEVHLPSAPLMRVLAQVRFSRLLAIRDSEEVAKFQKLLRPAYPILDEEVVPRLVIASGGAAPAIKEDSIWRFSSKDRKWRVSLGETFVTLETLAYNTRADFHERFSGVIAALAKVFEPQEAQRVGVRYIDRLHGEVLQQRDDILRRSVLGIWKDDVGDVAHTVFSEALLPSEEGAEIHLRWGLIAPGATMDPQLMEPIDQPSWVLDIDIYSSQPMPFEAKSLAELTTKFSVRAYSVFRWMTTDAFLRAHGGQP